MMVAGWTQGFNWLEVFKSISLSPQLALHASLVQIQRIAVVLMAKVVGAH